jgi:hypothetical protein
MKIFLICTVRLGVTEFSKKYVEKLESEGHKVHFPPRDTNQIDPLKGFNICIDNSKAIKESDEVHVIYNPKSQGIHFDLGVAWALGKKIKVVNPEEFPEEKSQNKSFLNMMEIWEKLS